MEKQGKTYAVHYPNNTTGMRYTTQYFNTFTEALTFSKLHPHAEVTAIPAIKRMK